MGGRPKDRVWTARSRSKLSHGPQHTHPGKVPGPPALEPALERMRIRRDILI